MLYISKWKAAAILLTAFVVCLLAVPNFFPEGTVKRWPAWAQRQDRKSTRLNSSH